MREPARRKLIEVALPLDSIASASYAETANPFIKAHPKSLKWWTRKPLAACRAVLFAQLVDDPSSRPEEFPTEADQDRERERLFGIIEQLVKWENSTNETVLEAARAEIMRSTDGDPPPILDPFAGGGSIPLEAQRLGLEAHASDLNPVAVLINKALIEIPPRWADQPPVHPDAERRTHWRGAEGLAEDVRLYGKWMRDEAERRIGHLYPKAKLEDGSEAPVIAWIWARTVTCPNPACRRPVPIMSTLWLSKKRGREAWAEPEFDGNQLRFNVRQMGPGPSLEPNVAKARFRCFECPAVLEPAETAEGMSSDSASDQIVAAYVQVDARRRCFVGSGSIDSTSWRELGTREHDDVPLPEDGRGFWYRAYGVPTVLSSFTSRQYSFLAHASLALNRCRELAVTAARTSGLGADAAGEYGRDLSVLLAQGLMRAVMFHNRLCAWNRHNLNVADPFSMTAPVFSWEFAEANPLTGSLSMEACARKVAEVVEALPARGKAAAVMSAAQDFEAGSEKFLIATDPPYYSNATYSDLSDVFYLWLKAALGVSHPEFFGTIAAPRSGELVSSPYRHGGSRDKADEYFIAEFTASMDRLRECHGGGGPMVLFYAFRQDERRDPDAGVTSTGWSTMLEGLVGAEWTVTATWPMRTERAARTRSLTSNALASSVVLACRPRPADAGVLDRRGFMRALRQRLPVALHELQKTHIAPADLRQAAIGPGMEIFSSFVRVVESDDSSMLVSTALELINQVLGEVLGEQEAEFDPETRWAIQWFSQFFEGEGAYEDAEQYAVALNVAVDGLRRSGIVESGRGKVRLLSRAEYPDAWDPLVDDRVPVWEACQQLVKRLEEQGEGAAGDLLIRLEQRGNVGEAAQLLAYRLFTVCERTRPALAGPYNALIAAWPEIQRHARNRPASAAKQDQLL